jgi:hypothetical protein
LRKSPRNAFRNSKASSAVRFPFRFDIELFGDPVLGLSMLWENIDELPGEEVTGSVGG